MERTGRFFLCARCRAQVLVCRCCDRGQIYCTGSCSQIARRACVREAGRRYQASRRGRFSHAARSRRYRARQKNVTHQGSLRPGPNALLPVNLALSVTQSQSSAAPRAWHCHFCGGRCPELVRSGFLHDSRVPLLNNRRGNPIGNSP